MPPAQPQKVGNLSGIADSCDGSTVNGAAWASQLTTQLAQPVTAGEPYYTSTCTTAAQCVFPNAQLSPTAFSPISAKLLQYVLPANQAIDPTSGTGTYLNSSEAINLTDNKFSGRVDANTSYGLLSAYYYFDRYNQISPYWPGNAPLYPGFGVDGKGQTHNVNLGDTKTFSSASVNEFRLGYFRLDTLFNQPQGGKGVTLASLGFASGASGAPGICAAGACPGRCARN